MKSFKLLIIILVIFIQTGNNLSANNLFFVNNVEIVKNQVILKIWLMRQLKKVLVN